jgi:hypothetical protein
MDKSWLVKLPTKFAPCCMILIQIIGYGLITGDVGDGENGRGGGTEQTNGELPCPLSSEGFHS